MKIFRHERVLIVISLAFVFFALLFSAQDAQSYTVVTAPDGNATEYLININTADVYELDILEGIGPSTAEKIVKYRADNGPFDSISELCNVPGIGPATLEKFKDFIEV